MIGVTLDAGAAAANLADLPGRADGALRQGSADLAARLRAIAERNLSGDVLKSRSGKLRDSLAAKVDLTGRIAATVTAATPYAAFQEYGLGGVETVRAHLRRTSQAFGRAIRPVTAMVQTHDRRVDYPDHSYLRSALAELAPDIKGAIAAALSGVLNPMNREAVQAALFAHMTGNVGVLSDIKTASRRLKSPQDIGAGNCPALFQIYKGETVEWSGMQPLKRVMHLDLVLYVHSGDKSFPTSSLLNPLLDAIEECFGTDPDGTLTLGGLVRRVTINGRIETDEGLLGEYAYAVVPVDLLIP